MKYFHGVNLPTEPDTSMGQDLSQFPYTLALMGKNNSGELVYTLYLTSKPFCFNPTTQSFEVKTPFELLLQVYYPTEDVWVQIPQDNTTSEEDLVFNPALFWNDEVLEYATGVSFLVGTNHDIVNTETGEVAFMVCDDVLLPSIPSNIDRSLYPYAYVVKMQEIETAKDVNYLLIVADKPMQTNSDGTNVVVAGTKGFNGSVSVYAENHCEWISEETEISSDMPLEQDGYTMTLIWSEVAEEKLYSIKESTLKNIGNSIRGKTGKTELIPPEDMPSEIDGISSGGAELNIHYGDTEPSDTSMLWCKCAEPSKVLVRNSITGTGESSKVENASLTYKGSYPCGANVGKNIYIFGGTKDNIVNAIQVFDTENETVRVLDTVLPLAKYGSSAIAVGTDIYVFGGGTSTTSTTSDIYKFDTLTETITTLSTTLKYSFVYGAGIEKIDKKIYVFGGYYTTSKGRKYCQIFDTETETIEYVLMNIISETNSYPISCIAIGTDIYLFTKDGKVSVFDSVAKSFSNITTLTQAHIAPCVAHYGDKIYLISSQGSTYSGMIEVFDINTLESVVLETSLLVTLYEYDFVVIGNTAYLFGGLYYYTKEGSTTKYTESTPYFYKYVVSMEVPSDELHIQSHQNQNLCYLLNGDTKFEVGVLQVFKGNSDNVGELVDAYLYKDGAWTLI